MMDADAAVLVTGATGFVGRAIVRRLLGAGRRVVALARPAAGQAAAGRVRAALDPLPQKTRLTVVGADLARLDAAAADLAWLRGSVVTVIHCAGDPRFFPDDPGAFQASHVDGPVALLQALAGDRLRSFAYMSTAFVCGQRRGRVLEEEGDVGQNFHNLYERTKLDAELALARAAGAHGLDFRVLRPSIVVGTPPPTAGGAPSNLFFAIVRQLAGLAALGRPARRVVRLPGAPAAPFNVVPVEYVADAAVALAEHPAGAHGTFHVVTSRPPTQAAVLAMVSQVLGVDGARVVEAYRIACDGSALERRLTRVLGPYTEYLAQDVRFDDERARSVLDAAGVAPAVLDMGAVERLVRLALAEEPAAP
jgi:nucleoside-diphosphate-sugar epimerase